MSLWDGFLSSRKACAVQHVVWSYPMLYHCATITNIPSKMCPLLQCMHSVMRVTKPFLTEFEAQLHRREFMLFYCKPAQKPMALGVNLLLFY